MNVLGIEKMKRKLVKNLFTKTFWTVKDLERADKIISEIYSEMFGYERFPVQYEIINDVEFLNNYVSHGMPIYYSHRSLGEQFLGSLEDYKKKNSLLAYELIINSNPSICYLSEHNTLLTQLVVIAHAAMGHNAFFANNYLFNKYTEPKEIVNFLKYASAHIDECYEYSETQTSLVIDIIESLFVLCINQSACKILSRKEQIELLSNRIKMLKDRYNPVMDGEYSDYFEESELHYFVDALSYLQEDKNSSMESEYDLLKFIANNGKLSSRMLEIFNIFSTLYRYFFPQMKTKVMNEGYANFTHHEIIKELYYRGYIPEEYMLEFFVVNSGVTSQFIPKYSQVFNAEWFKFNPYYLGQNIFFDIKRMCENPTQEDIDFNPYICNTNYKETIKYIISCYNDETFILDFLSPKVIRDMKMFHLTEHNDDYYLVENISTEDSYKTIRKELANQYSFNGLPEINCYKGKISSMFSGEEEKAINIIGLTYDKEKFKLNVSEDYLITLLSHVLDHPNVVVRGIND